MIDGTVFLALLGFAFFFMLYPSQNHKGTYSIIAMIFFFSLCVISFSGQDITTESVTTDGITSWTSTTYIIKHNDFSVSVFGWVFFLFALLCIFAAFVSFTQSTKEFKRNHSNQEM